MARVFDLQSRKSPMDQAQQLSPASIKTSVCKEPDTVEPESTASEGEQTKEGAGSQL